MNMPFEEGNDLIKFALNEEDDEKMFFRWAIAYQSQMSFDDFKNCIIDVGGNIVTIGKNIITNKKCLARCYGFSVSSLSPLNLAP